MESIVIDLIDSMGLFVLSHLISTLIVVVIVVVFVVDIVVVVFEAK